MVKILEIKLSTWSSRVINLCKEKCQLNHRMLLLFLFQSPLIKVFAVLLTLLLLEMLRKPSSLEQDPTIKSSQLVRKELKDWLDLSQIF
jgi:hypothetical protein